MTMSIIIIIIVIVVYKNGNDHVQCEGDHVLRKIPIYLHFVNWLKRISLQWAKIVSGR